MNAHVYSAPAESSYPAASFYSANGLTLTVGSGTVANPVYGTATTPGVSGPSFAGLRDPSAGNNSYAVAINGLGGDNGGTANVNIGNNVSIAEAIPVDAGYNTLLDPTGRTPFSVTAWFRGNPADANGNSRNQGTFGHTDNSWRFLLDVSGKVHFRAGNGPGEITSARVYNDGNWHQLVGTYDGTNEILYVDAVVDSTLTGQTGAITGSPQDILIGGDAMYLNGGNGIYASSPQSTATYNQRTFAGSVAHCAFFTNVLSAAQITALYQSAGAPPVILGQPFGPRTNGYAFNGTNTYFFVGVTASGSAPLSYQWYLTNASGVTLLTDGSKYSNAATAQLTISNLIDSDSGTYFVVVTNNYGAVTSAISGTAGLIQIYSEPKILGQTPAGGTFQAYAGQTLPAFSATVTGDTNSLGYQWLTNGVAVAGATATTFSLSAIQLANENTVISFVATNLFGAATYAAVTLQALADPAAPTNAYAQSILALNPTGY
jgi:hypothetical protein